jgi:hypothetical protein
MPCKSLFSQIVFTQNFTDRMHQLGLSCNKPADDFLKVFPLDKDEFFDYDLVLRTDDRAAELRIVSYDADANLIPNIEMMSRISSFATNVDTADIIIYSLRESMKKFYNATWAMEAEFVPKVELTHFPRATMIAIYREDYGLILNTVFHDHNKNIDSFKLLLSFQVDN